MRNKIILMVMRALYKCVCTVLKQDEKKLTFYSFPDASDNSWHFFCYLIEHSEDKKFVWICENPDVVAQRIKRVCKNSKNQIEVLGKYSFRGLFQFCSSYFAFTTTMFYPFTVSGYGPLVISLWHGMPIKRLGTYNKSFKPGGGSIDYLISSSGLFSGIMAHAFNMTEDQVLPVGLPRNDALLRGDDEVETRLRTSLNIHSDQKIVFWLPTYRRSSPRYGLVDGVAESFLDEWDTGFLERLNQAAGCRGVTVIIKLHPADQLNAEQHDHDFSHVRILQSSVWESMELDLYDALAVSDALISDISSVLIDYMVTGKSIAVTVSSLDGYTRGVTPGLEAIFDEFSHIDDESSFAFFLSDLSAVERHTLDGYGLYNEQAVTRHSACQSVAEHFRLIT